MEHEAQKARITLKAIESLTYTCSEHEILFKLNRSLDSLLLEFRKELPHEEGLVIRPLVAKRAKNTKKSLKAKVSSLQLYKKRGRACVDSKYRNRVGKRADKLRKVIKLRHQL